MCLLSDREIREAMRLGDLSVDPFVEEALQPASVDIRLGDSMLSWDQGFMPKVIDPRARISLMRNVPRIRHKPDQPSYWQVPPNVLVLASTLEVIDIGAPYAARVEGKSSWGRLGLIVHATAGFVDPGWHGRLTLELMNLSPVPIILRPGDFIAQLAFERLSSAPTRLYEGRYQGDMTAAPSRYHQGREE